MAKRKISEPREWIFRGRVTLEGVQFFITADSEDEAIERARKGDFDDRDDGGGESVDWHIDVDSIELNE